MSNRAATLLFVSFTSILQSLVLVCRKKARFGVLFSTYCASRRISHFVSASCSASPKITPPVACPEKRRLYAAEYPVIRPQYTRQAAASPAWSRRRALAEAPPAFPPPATLRSAAWQLHSAPAPCRSPAEAQCLSSDHPTVRMYKLRGRTDSSALPRSIMCL